jgi:hypothetical protein
MAILKLQVVICTASTGDFAFPPIGDPGDNCQDLDYRGGELGHVSTEQAAAGVVGLAVQWSDANGGLTATPPPATRARIRVGRVLTANATTGVLWVDVRVLPAIGDLTGVDVSSIAELQVLQWKDVGGGTLALQNVQPGDASTVAPLDASARIPDQHLRWSRFLMMMGD